MTVPRLRVTAVTHRGLVREENEDTIGIAGWALRGTDADAWIVERTAPLEVVVADGMGGHAGGATASSLAVTAFFAEPGTVGDRLAAADGILTGRADEQTQLRGMGTTMVGASIGVDGTVVVFGVGDSRAYRVVGGYLGRLTSDDRVLLSGANALTQYLGRGNTLDPHERTVALGPGDRLLLCSDGVHDVLDDARLAELLDNASPILIRDAVLDGGAPDNLSYVIVDVLPDA